MALAAAAIKLGRSSTAVAFSAKSLENDVKVMVDDRFCLLIKPDGQTIAAFGEKAEEEYACLREDGESEKYYYFTNILVKLGEKCRHAKNDVTKISIEDEMGKSLLAQNVLSLTIDYLRNDLQKGIGEVVRFETDVYIVIMVPEFLHTTGATELIRKAALKCEIDVKMLSVITDFEAASVCYQHTHPTHTRNKSEKRFLVVKAGSITERVVQEVDQNGKIKAVSPLRAYDYGGMYVDEAVEKIFMEIIGEDVWNIFKANFPLEFLHLIRSIELKKRYFHAKTEMITFTFPIELLTLYQQTTGKCFKEAVTKSRHVVTLFKDKMRLSDKEMRSSIKEATENITSMIKGVLKTSDVNAVLMFGGFANSPLLQQVMQASLPNVSLVNSLKGAVIVGHKCLKKISVTARTTMVAAIDFGTTYSGWASSSVAEFKSDRTNVLASTWHSGSTITSKTPTCILIRPDGKTIEAFGYDAENRYRELIERDEDSDYYYFQRFKMLLNKKLGEQINREITLEDEMGRSLRAIDVFALSIKFLKEDVLLVNDKRLVGGVTEQDILWVLTVPAIWTDGAKQFMREAAIKAGIGSQRLVIALEPEAASLYCRHLSVEKTIGNTGVSTFKAGTRYMILDAGGGTIDITVHEVDINDAVKEVHSACGGGWGGTMVDREFENVLIALLSKKLYLQLKGEDTEDWLELWRDFEIKKRAVCPKNVRPIKMKLPLSLIEMFQEHTGRSLKNAISSSEYAKDIELTRDKITLSEKLSMSFFKESIDNTIGLVKSTLKDIQVKAILMVGGYSESPMLQQAIRSTFSDIEVVVPLEASYSIMKGALIFGHLPRFITKRVLKYTYGICMVIPFVEGKHPESKRLHTDKGDMCDTVFDKHIEKNQSVEVGESQVRKVYFPVYKQQKQIRFHVYASEMTNPEYTDQNCHIVGKMLVDLGDEGDLDRAVQVALTFSDTEIVVQATEKKTGKETHAAIDFLG